MLGVPLQDREPEDRGRLLAGQEDPLGLGQGGGVLPRQGAQLDGLGPEEAERSAQVAEEAAQFHGGCRGSV